MIAALIKYFPAIFPTLARMLRIPYFNSATAVPVILPPSGTIDASGNLTLTAALPEVFSGGAWCYFPASAFATAPAGVYWVVFNTNTVGSVKNVFADPSVDFIPYVPSGTPAPAVGSGAAYTQTTGVAISLIGRRLPANSVTASGSVKFRIAGRNSSSANAKIASLLCGGANIITPLNNTVASLLLCEVAFRGRGYFGRVMRIPYISTTTSSPFSFAVDYSTALQYNLTANLANASEYVVIDNFEMEIEQ